MNTRESGFSAVLLVLMMLAVMLILTASIQLFRRASIQSVRVHSLEQCRILLQEANKINAERLRDEPADIITMMREHGTVFLAHGDGGASVFAGRVRGEMKTKAYAHTHNGRACIVRCSIAHWDAATFRMGMEINTNALLGGEVSSALSCDGNGDPEAGFSTPYFGAAVSCLGPVRFGGGFAVHWGSILAYLGDMTLGTSAPSGARIAPLGFTVYPRKFLAGRITDFAGNELRPDNDIRMDAVDWSARDAGHINGKYASRDFDNLLDRIDYAALRQWARNYTVPLDAFGQPAGLSIRGEDGFTWDHSGFLRLKSSIGSAMAPTMIFDGWRPAAHGSQWPVFYVEEGDANILIKGNSCLGRPASPSEDILPVFIVVPRGRLNIHVNTYLPAIEPATTFTVKVPPAAEDEYRCVDNFPNQCGSAVTQTGPAAWAAEGWAAGAPAVINTVCFYGVIIAAGHGVSFQNLDSSGTSDPAFIGVLAARQMEPFVSGDDIARWYYSPFLDGNIPGRRTLTIPGWTTRYDAFGAGLEEWNIFDNDSFTPAPR